MKKLFVLAVIFAVVLMFAGCPDDGKDNTNNSDVIGTWMGVGAGETGQHFSMELEITKSLWTFVVIYTGDPIPSTSIDSGTWKQNGNILSLKGSKYPDITATLSDGKLIVSGYGVLVFTLTKSNSVTKPSSDTGTLKITNESGFEITDVQWNSVPFANNSTDNSIKPGTSVSKSVTPGNGYIRLKLKTNSTLNARSYALVTVEKDKQAEFVFQNTTVLVDDTNTSNSATLGSFSGVPMITVKQGDKVINNLEDYPFGTILFNTTKEVAFTVENSGGANLIIDTSRGNKVNLADNDTGFYSVNLQPISTTIPPGISTSFIISFGPTTIRNNNAATVQIKTNSQDNSEFVFRVIGNSSKDYQIGETGPGGGTIFFAEGGQYKECSGELGICNWWDAQELTKNFRGGEFTDWRLPDRVELSLLYENLHKNGIGGFSNAYYWSSAYTNDGYYHAYRQNFATGSWELTDYHYSSSSRVRAIRSFYLY